MSVWAGYPVCKSISELYIDIGWMAVAAGMSGNHDFPVETLKDSTRDGLYGSKMAVAGVSPAI